MIDGDRGLAPIARSAALVRGQLVAERRSSGSPSSSSARRAAGADRRRVRAARALRELLRDRRRRRGVASVVTLPFLAIGATLYYLRLRDAAATASRALARF